MLIVFEGPDSVGKSTISTAFAARLRELQPGVVAVHHWSFPGRDIGTLGQLVYRLHHSPGELGVASLTPASLQLLHIAAHLDAIESRILPALGRGDIVILDRFWWSTAVYGTVTGADRETLSSMIEVELRAWRTVLPTMVFLVDRSSPFALRGDERLMDWQRLRAEYEALASRQSVGHPVVRIANDGDDVSHVVDRAMAALSQPHPNAGTLGR